MTSYDKHYIQNHSHALSQEIKECRNLNVCNDDDKEITRTMKETAHYFFWNLPTDVAFQLHESNNIGAWCLIIAMLTDWFCQGFIERKDSTLSYSIQYIQ